MKHPATLHLEAAEKALTNAGRAKGGRARAERLSPERRAEIASMGGRARAGTRVPKDPAKKRRQRERAEMRKLVAWARTGGLRLGVVVKHTENEETGGAGIRNGHARHQAQMLDGVVDGWPDLDFYWLGLAYFIEMKVDQEPLREAQEKCHAMLRAAGCKVETCYSAEEAKGVLKGWGLTA